MDKCTRITLNVGDFPAHRMTVPMLPVAPRSGRSGFSLMELLVAMAVLVIISALLFQISEQTHRAVRTSHQQMDATQQARIVLDTLSADFSNLVAQNGFTVFVKQDGTNTKLCFLARSRGPAGSSDFRFMAIGYALEGSEMVRRSSPMTWSEMDFVTKPVNVMTTGDRDILAKGVLRFEAVAVLENGAIVPVTQSGLTTLFGDVVPGGFAALPLNKPPFTASQSRVTALIVAVASVDEQNISLPRVSQIADLLKSPAAGRTPLDLWTETVNSSEFAVLPRPAVAALQMIQETIPLR
ncbi:MAG: hypothetical protein B9S32_10810 [Verrucomicrobia bacterium Tous-C9LFEB]|nr:MAG: hypothetical protein B9S32_10810 [Verrucomicrobia bacterium Tous-C9LFEB]